MKVKSCLTLCDPVDCSPPSFSVHGILQARILGFSRQKYWSGLLFPASTQNSGKHSKSAIHACKDSSVMSDCCDPMDCSPRPRLLCPRDSPGKSNGVGCYAFLQVIFLTQGSNPCLRHLTPLTGGFLTTIATWEAQRCNTGPLLLSPLPFDR